MCQDLPFVHRQSIENRCALRREDKRSAQDSRPEALRMASQAENMKS